MSPAMKDELGMSLRDYFAGQMLSGIYAAESQRRIVEGMNTESKMQEMNLSDVEISRIAQARIADMCYDQADAMLKARTA